MGSSFWILISISIILILFLAFWLIIRKGKQRPIDYYSLFIIGIIWLIVGLPLKNYTLSALGAVFLIVGLVNRKKWEQNRVRWSDLSEGEKKFKIVIMVILGLLVLVGLVVFYLVEKGKIGL